MDIKLEAVERTEAEILISKFWNKNSANEVHIDNIGNYWIIDKDCNAVRFNQQGIMKVFTCDDLEHYDIVSGLTPFRRMESCSCLRIINPDK